MTKYKGYLIESYSKMVEGKSPAAGSCNAEGNGIFTEHYYTRVIDPKSGKSMSARDEDEAKKIIDAWFTPAGKARAKEFQLIMEREEAALRKLEIATNALIKKAENELSEAESRVNKMRNKMPPSFY